MGADLKGLYFRKLRMLYCSELQLISFYCEAAARTGSHGVEALTDQSRDRRNLLEMLASEHGICVAGDDCQSMRRLIASSRKILAESHSLCGDVPEEICESVHRLQILNYSVARSLAAKARLGRDVKRLDEALDTLLESFPLACEAVVPVGMTGPFEVARRG
jgi:hypothetical protein